MQKIIIKLLLAISFFVAVKIFLFFLVILDKKNSSITIGCKNCTENQILAEMISILIENKTNLKVKRKYNLEGTFICFLALKSKDIDIYPEYYKTAYLTILKRNEILKKEEMIDFVKNYFEKNLNIVWLYPFGFENRYEIFITKANAKKHNLNKISDLKDKKYLTYAFDPEFAIREEFLDLKKKYFQDI